MMQKMYLNEDCQALKIMTGKSKRLLWNGLMETQDCRASQQRHSNIFIQRAAIYCLH